MGKRNAERKCIGIITEGRGELVALPMLYAQLEEKSDCTIMNPIHVPVDPQAPVPLLCSRLEVKVKHAQGRGAHRVIVLLDSEKRDICPGVRAREISLGLKARGLINFQVVLKHTRLENWLIADISAFQVQKKLFPRAEKVTYPRGNADEVNAQRLISSALAGGRSYSKIIHPQKILAHADVAVMLKNSASFDKFVRELSG